MSFEVDEIIPVSLGGDELDFDNVQPAHRICNERKGNKIAFTCDSPRDSSKRDEHMGDGLNDASTAW